MSYTIRAIAFLALVQPAAASTLHTIFSFGRAGNLGTPPAGQIVADSAGNLYGVTSSAVYRLSPPSTGVIWSGVALYQFVVGRVGVVPSPGLAGSPAKFFGATDANSYGENYGCGSVYALNLISAADAVATPISRLNTVPASGCYPVGPVNVAANGDVFAIAANGGDFYGNIMLFKPPGGVVLPGWASGLMPGVVGSP